MKRKHRLTQVSLSEDQSNLIEEVLIVDPKRRDQKNRSKSWAYGYDKEHDMVVISRDGTIGSVYNVQGLNIALPKQPDNVYSRDKKKEAQYWSRSTTHKSCQGSRT